MEWMCIKIKQGSTHRQITMHEHSIDFNYAKQCGIVSFVRPPKISLVFVCVCVSPMLTWQRIHTASLSWPIEHLFLSFDLRPVSCNLSLYCYFQILCIVLKDQMMWRFYALKKCVKFCMCCSINFTSLIHSMHAFYPFTYGETYYVLLNELELVYGCLRGWVVGVFLAHLYHLSFWCFMFIAIFDAVWFITPMPFFALFSQTKCINIHSIRNTQISVFQVNYR